jgi:8-oxo-dGTP diphosphatase
MIVVTAALIKQGDKVLITQRLKSGHQGLKWEFPGGKVEEGEHPEECLKRELMEELGIEVRVNEIFKVVSHKYADRHILLLCYECTLLKGELSALECNDFRWVSAQELDKYDFAGADKVIVEKLKGVLS